MSHPIEIVIPLRNPTEVLSKSIQSLIAQTDRRFSVLISDNHSTEGLDRIASAESSLKAVGIDVCVKSPPYPCGRVEHWNWAHTESAAVWLKPLFVGDWLEPQAVARWHETIAAFPEARFIHFGYEFHGGNEPAVTVVGNCIPKFRAPGEMNDYVLRFGHQFGPPNAVLFERDAFAAVGGFLPVLPICADSLLCCEFARRFGTVGIPEVLSHFQLHGARFSMSIPGRPSALLREKTTYLAMLAYHTWTENRPIPWMGFLRMLAREIRSYFRDAEHLRNAAV